MKENEMDSWRVSYRPDSGIEYATYIPARRVEGWTEDYAFFAHPTSLGIATTLIPRAIVLEVQRDGIAVTDGA